MVAARGEEQVPGTHPGHGAGGGQDCSGFTLQSDVTHTFKDETIRNCKMPTTGHQRPSPGPCVAAPMV